MTALFDPIARAIGQIGDRAFLGVLIRSLLWAGFAFLALHLGVSWMVHHLLAGHGRVVEFIAEILGNVAVWVLGYWLFLPLAALIAACYVEPIARAVERRFYPALPQVPGAPILAQLADGLIVAWQILLLGLVALIAILVLPGIGLLAGLAIAAFALGRGLFVVVAMRRMDRATAMALWRAHRWPILLQGALLAAAGLVPVVNFLVPVIGTAAMVHVAARLGGDDGRALRART
ncbi:MAG: EI24 domain-containing protein [Rhodospirillales bacterium]|nr:EI24 domain-containing protein [Rhodospirillales bacterium]